MKTYEEIIDEFSKLGVIRDWTSAEFGRVLVELDDGTIRKATKLESDLHKEAVNAHHREEWKAGNL